MSEKIKQKYYLVYTIGDKLREKRTGEEWVIVANYFQSSVFSNNFDVKNGKFSNFKLLKEPKSLDIKCYYLLSLWGNGLKAIPALSPHPSKNFAIVKRGLKMNDYKK